MQHYISSFGALIHWCGKSYDKHSDFLHEANLHMKTKHIKDIEKVI